MYTDRAHRAVVLAQEEARLFNHNYIGTEHILLGLIHEGDGVAAKALELLDISLETVRGRVEKIIGLGGSSPSGHIPFTPRSRKVFELALRESLQMGHNYVGTEHLLLGLVREGEGVAAGVLKQLGADLPLVRQTVLDLLSSYNTIQAKEPEKEVVHQDPWWMIDYQNARGEGCTATIQAAGWCVDEGFVQVGGHSFSQRSVTSILRVESPPENNVHTPAGMKPLEETPESPKPLPVSGPADDPNATQPLTYQSAKEMRQKIDAALEKARAADPTYPRLQLKDEIDNEARRSREQKWGEAMAKAISMARITTVPNRLTGGVICVPENGSPPFYVAPDYTGLKILDDIRDEYQDALDDESE